MSSWESQQTREEALLSLDRAGGLSMGTGLAGTIEITHTIGTDGEGTYASYLILGIRNNRDERVEIPLAPGYAGTLDQLIGSLRYHASEVARMNKERQGVGAY